MIKDRIKTRMNDLEIRAVDITRATGANKSTVSAWVSGTREPSAQYLIKLAECLKCGVDWLIFGVEKPETKDDKCMDNFRILTIAQKDDICGQVAIYADANRKLLAELKDVM